VLGAKAYGAEHIVASEGTLELIRERGAADWASEVQRFPRLFRAADSVRGLTWPTITFETRMTVLLGKRTVEISHLGRGHTKGDTVVWLPDERILYSGDLVEYGATPYAGDAYFGDWPATLAKLATLKPEKLVPGRGNALMTADDSLAAIDGTRRFVSELHDAVKQGRAAGRSLKSVFDAVYRELAPRYGNWVIFEHCLPFDVSRSYDEAGGVADPRIWTAERDVEMWQALQSAPPS